MTERATHVHSRQIKRMRYNPSDRETQLGKDEDGTREIEIELVSKRQKT